MSILLGIKSYAELALVKQNCHAPPFSDHSRKFFFGSIVGREEFEQNVVTLPAHVTGLRAGQDAGLPGAQEAPPGAAPDGSGQGERRREVKNEDGNWKKKRKRRSVCNKKHSSLSSHFFSPSSTRAGKKRPSFCKYYIFEMTCFWTRRKAYYFFFPSSHLGFFFSSIKCVKVALPGLGRTSFHFHDLEKQEFEVATAWKLIKRQFLLPCAKLFFYFHFSIL